MSTLDDLTAHRLLADIDRIAASDRANLAAANLVVEAADKEAQDTQPPVPLRKALAQLQAAEPDRLAWPDSWFDGSEPDDAAACQRLWSSALLACIRSAVRLSADDLNNSNVGAPVARSWIGSRDFHMMCSLAGIDGVACYERLSRLSQDPEMRQALLGAHTKKFEEARV